MILNMSKKFICIIILFLISFSGKSTNYNMGNGTYTITCPGPHNFYDSGGNGGNYANSESYTVTFYPSVAGQCISLTFSSFDTESCCDPVSVYNGPNSGSPLLGTFQGTAIPPTVTSTGGPITIVFTSDGSIVGTGWAATLNCVACPPPPAYYLMSNGTQTLTCPPTYSLFYDSGGPGAGNYSNNENLTKTFTAPAGNCLSFNFNSAFATEACCDRLRIFDGPTGASPLIGTYVGTTGPGLITSSGTSLTFSFTSDGSVVDAGWTATISCAAPCTGTPSGGTASNTATTVCPSSVALVVTGAGTGCGLIYQWQSATSSSVGPWSNIAGATSTTYTAPISTQIYYRRLTSCGVNTGTSSIVTVTVGATPSACPLSSYNAAGTAYTFETFVGTNAPSTDDVLFNSTINLGFNFCFGGSQYGTAYIASNGAIVFDAVPCFPNIQTTTYAAPGIWTGYSISAAAPVNNTSIPRNAILGPWHDIDPSLGGLIEYATLGVAPNRRFVVSYDQVPMFSCGVAAGVGQFFSGQIKIYETSGNIEIHVRNKQLCTTWNGGDAVMGLHNFDGTIYRPPVNATAHNYPTNWTMTNTGYQWTASCANCAVLPIEFKNFYGQRVDQVNKIFWETALEENVESFSVMRSIDAENFYEIARVTAKNKASLYNYDDIETKPGTLYYYKIISNEKNGVHKSTNVIPLGSNLNEVMVSGIYPNPVQSDFVMSVDSRSATELEVKIYDIVGKLVKSFTRNSSIGVQQLNFSIPELSSGSYMIEVRSADKQVITQQKLIKVD